MMDERTDRPVAGILLALGFASVLYLVTRSGFTALLAGALTSRLIWARPQDSPARHVLMAAGITALLGVVWLAATKLGV